LSRNCETQQQSYVGLKVIISFQKPNTTFSTRYGMDPMNNEILSLEKSAMERWRNGDPMGFVD
jgi:hypothetical protein